MATLNIEIIKNKLLDIQDHINRIDRMEFTLTEIQSNHDIQDLISHRMHTAVETAILLHILFHHWVFFKKKKPEIYLWNSPTTKSSPANYQRI